jgi:uncharacterized protein YeaO (DUF488 family)
MPIKTRRWNQRRKRGEGWRVLICRYRPRALAKEKETWDTWYPDLGPSKELHADFYGKKGTPISWEEYRRRYLLEMQGEQQQEMIAALAELLAEGKTITLLCSSACKDASHCHRTLLQQLIEEQAAALPPVRPAPAAAQPGA